MTKAQAHQALNEGKKVGHPNFIPIYIYKKENIIYSGTTGNRVCPFIEFNNWFNEPEFNEGWSIHEDTEDIQQQLLQALEQAVEDQKELSNFLNKTAYTATDLSIKSNIYQKRISLQSRITTTEELLKKIKG